MLERLNGNRIARAVRRLLVAAFGQPQDLVRGRIDESERDVCRRVLENATELIAIIGVDGVAWASPACVEALGYSRNELDGRRLAQLVSPEDVATAHDAWLRVIEGERVDVSLRVRTRARAWLHLELTVSPLGDGTALVVARDVTRRTEAERRSQLFQRQLAQAQKMESIGHLAAGVAHDFNNVLLAVRGYAELIGWEAGSSSAIRGFADEISCVCERATGLTRQLLAFGRTQAMVPELLDLNGVVIETRRLLDPLVGEKVALEFDLAGDVPAISADRGHLEQSIVNLSLNASHAMPDGGVLTISTTAVRVDGRGPLALANVLPGEYARLDVRDTGVGMDAETQTHIFEPFATVNGVETPGLGLSTVYGFVAQSGGHVAVESSPGGGACFSILLPVASRGYVAELSDASPSQRSASPSHRSAA
jgi:two-component system, cell cycle sensor histidine kinase and response regulator CckA